MGDVKFLKGGATMSGEPHPEAIEQARRLLEMAEAGEITGFGYVACHANGGSSHSLAGLVHPVSFLGHSYHLNYIVHTKAALQGLDGE